MALGDSFVKGFIAGSDRVSKQADIHAKQTEAYDKTIGNVIKAAGEMAKAFTTGEHASTPEEFTVIINKMMDSAATSSNMAIGKGYAVTPPEQIENYRQILLKAATPSQLGQTKGSARGAELVAEAEGVSEGGGVPLIEAQTARGLRPKGPDTVINIGDKISNAGQKKATEKLGEGIGKRADDRLTQAFDAKRQNLQLDRVKLGLSRGARTGLGSEALLDLQSIASTFGVKVPEKVSEAELIRTVGNEMALRLRNPESGLGLTGNTSNKDLDFLKNSIPGLGRTKQGNLTIIDMTKRFNELKVSLADEQLRIIEENGGVVPNNLDKKLLEFVDNYKFLSPTERKEIESMVGGKKEQTTFPGLSPAGSAAFEKYRPK